MGFGTLVNMLFAILYLWAYKAYSPSVADRNKLWLRNYAHKIKKSVDAQEETFRRFVGYDEAVLLLFPELQEDIGTGFGELTAQGIGLNSN